MDITRRQSLTGLAGILAAGVAPAAVVRSMLGARGVATTNNTDKEEEMYKEMFKSLVERTFTGDLIDSNGLITMVGDYALSNLSGLKNVTLPECTNVGGSAFRTSFNCNLSDNVEIHLPKCTALGSYAFYGPYNNKGPVTVDIPLVSRIVGQTFVGCLNLRNVICDNATVFDASSFPSYNALNVYMRNSTEAQIKGFANYPFGLKAGSTIHASDGDFTV